VVAEGLARGWQVQVRDLYDGFDPKMSISERARYFSGFQGEADVEMAELATAEVLILVFPTWWSGFPAVLKGWFDRVWAPGLAYDHPQGAGAMIPRLTGLRAVLAVTTYGAPAWVDWLVMRRPLVRILRRGIVAPCAPGARVRWRALYGVVAVERARLARFETQIAADIAGIARRLG